MKKILLGAFLLLVSATIISCNDSSITTNQTTEVNATTYQTTIDDTTTNLTEDDYDAYFPDYPDEDYFVYAEVVLYFTYDIPSEGFSDREMAKTFYETRNLMNFDLVNFDSEGNFDDYYLSSYTPYVSLVYKTKSGLFDDFYLLQTAFENNYVEMPTIILNTIGETFKLTLESDIDDLIEQTDKYFGTEITYDSISFEVIYTSNSWDNIEDYQGGGEIFKTYTEYLTDFPENNFDLTQSFFDNNVLIISSFGHSSSLQIGNVEDLFYLDETTLEIAISATATNQIMTGDYNPYMVVLSMDKSSLRENTIITIHKHTIYLSGYLYDKPFHNIYDDNN
ncbi:MAG: hypothetical protein R6U15_07505 [Candidatus Izemoplasmatales bacterium]